MGAQETAQANVALKYDPQQAALDRALQANQGMVQANEAGINQYGTSGRQNIGSVYDTLASLLGANRADSATAINQQVGRVGAGYDVADQVQRAAADEGRNRLSSLAQQLGQQGAQLQVQNPFEAQVANLIGNNATQKANATGNLSSWGTQWDQILGQGQNIGEQSRAKGLTDLEIEIAKMLGQNKVAGLTGENDIRGRMADLLGARQNDLISMFDQYSQRDWENAFKQAQLDQDASKANASLAMDQQRINLQAEGQAADNAYRSSQASKANTISALDLMKIAAGQQDREDQMGQQKFANNMATQNYGLDRMKTLAALSGDSGPDGNQMFLDYFSKQGVIPDPSQRQAYADYLGQLGYPVDFYNGQSSSVAGAKPMADSNMTNPNSGWQYMPFYGYTETRNGPGGVKQYR